MRWILVGLMGLGCVSEDGADEDAGALSMAHFCADATLPSCTGCSVTICTIGGKVRSRESRTNDSESRQVAALSYWPSGAIAHFAQGLIHVYCWGDGSVALPEDARRWDRARSDMWSTTDAEMCETVTQ